MGVLGKEGGQLRQLFVNCTVEYRRVLTTLPRLSQILAELPF
jgi:hypothetical protein